MTKNDDKKPKNIVLIDYKELRTISLDEFYQAVFTDIQALKDIYNVGFLTAPRIKLPITNEYGDPRRIRHPEGHFINRMDTHYYRPACLDYRL